MLRTWHEAQYPSLTRCFEMGWDEKGGHRAPLRIDQSASP